MTLWGPTLGSKVLQPFRIFVYTISIEILENSPKKQNNIFLSFNHQKPAGLIYTDNIFSI